MLLLIVLGQVLLCVLHQIDCRITVAKQWMAVKIISFLVDRHASIAAFKVMLSYF